MEPILVAQGISKQFPGVRALDEVDFDLVPGEVHALVGENGAGKSTLIKIFGGLLQPTSGSLLLNGKPVQFENPLQSQSAGISVITQEFNLVPQLTVAENIFLGREPKRTGGLIDWAAIRRRSETLLDELGVHVPANQRIEYLGVGDQQLVEIAKALSREFRVIIMDEPTAALNAAEVERLFAIIAGLRQRNVAVLYVSHRLNEIFRIADRVTVLRDGKHVATRPLKQLTESDIITLMLGRELAGFTAQHEEVAATQTPALEVRKLSAAGSLEEVSFELRYGEVLGCAGLIGSGRSELMRVLVGLRSHAGGAILVDGKPVSFNNSAEALRAGIFMLPEDRKTEGIFPHLTVEENLVINAARSAAPGGGQSRPGVLIDQPAERQAYQKVRETLAIRARGPAQSIMALSGGNQQKVLLGRALVSQSRIVLLNEPTRGVDVATKLEIHALIRRLAAEGHAILVSSSDVPELVNVSDRCLVLSAGRVARLLRGDQITEDNIVAGAVGHVDETNLEARRETPHG
jgi:ABC-type sugar transport system ATPase subunit